MTTSPNLNRCLAALALAAFLNGCASSPAIHNRHEGAAHKRIGAVLIGAGIGAVLIGATTAVTVADMPAGPDRDTAYYVGVPLGAIAGAGAGAIVAWLLGETPAVDKAKAKTAVHVPYQPGIDDLPPTAQTREEALQQAGDFEAESRWALAWGAYRRARDLGPPSDAINSKIKFMEAKLGVQPADRTP